MAYEIGIGIGAPGVAYREAAALQLRGDGQPQLSPLHSSLDGIDEPILREQLETS